MVLIIGASYAGKRDIATDLFNIKKFTDGKIAAFDEVLTSHAVCNYQLVIRRLLDADESPQEFTKRLISGNPDALILMDEVGAGIIPLAREDRIWRESCGICSRNIAKNSELVIRVVCGIPQVLKGELP